MSSGGIGSLNKTQLNQINILANKPGSDKYLLVANFKGKEVKFSAVEEAKMSPKPKELIEDARLAAKTLGMKDWIVSVSPAKAQKLITAWNESAEEIHANMDVINFLNGHLASSGSTPHKDSLDANGKPRPKVKAPAPLPRPLKSNTSPTHSAKGSSISGSTPPKDSLDANGEPIFGTFKPRPKVKVPAPPPRPLKSNTSPTHSAKGSSISGSTPPKDSLDANGEPIFGTFKPRPKGPKVKVPAPPVKVPAPPVKVPAPPPRPLKSNTSPTHSAKGSSISGSTQPQNSVVTGIHAGLQFSNGKSEITFAPAGDLDLPPNYPAPPPPIPPIPPKTTTSNSKPQLTPHSELSSLVEKYEVNIRPIKINGSSVGYIFSNPRGKGEPRPITLLVETHGEGYADGKKITPFTTPANTRFLMAARRNQTFEVAPWIQADAISRGQINFSHNDQVYGSLDQGSGIRMTNYHLSPITKEQGEKYDLSLEKTAQLMEYFRKSADGDGRINKFNMFMLDPNMAGDVSTEDLMAAFDREGIHYQNIIMNVCRPQEDGDVSMTMAIENIQREKQNRISQMGSPKKQRFPQRG